MIIAAIIVFHTFTSRLKFHKQYKNNVPMLFQAKALFSSPICVTKPPSPQALLRNAVFNVRWRWQERIETREMKEGVGGVV